MKSIIILSLGVLFFTACKKKDNKPTEYFSFDANGVHYEYPQIKKQDLFGGIQTLSAGPTSATVGYQIYAYSTKNPAAQGAFTFAFSNNEIPERDTIILDGIHNSAGIAKFQNFSYNYEIRTSLSGRIIFTERSSALLKGTFEFNAYKMHTVGLNQEPTDTVIHITNGKFSIIPVQEQA